MKDAYVKLGNIELWVQYEHDPGERGSYYEAPDPGYFELKEVYISDTEWDITDQLNESERESIKSQILNLVAA